MSPPDTLDGGRSGSREAILGRIAEALGRGAGGDAAEPAKDSGGDRGEASGGARAASVADRPAAVAERLAARTRRTLPRSEPDLAAQLVRNMEAVQMSVVRLQGDADVPGAVAFWLESEGLGGDVTVAPALGSLDWPSGEDGRGRLWRRGAATGEEATSVTPCLAAVAETGSVALASGAGTPATLNFLPENHVVVVRAGQIVAHVEDALERVRALDTLPRALNFVTGPSRTADIEQTIEIGAHGPRRMHVLIVEGGEA